MIDHYRARGWVPVPIRPGEKRPAEPAWQTRTLESPWPSGEWDIGLVLGAASGGLVDVDLDCPEAVALAPALLPRTAAFGHRPERGHLLFVCPAIGKREAYECGGMLVEIRASDCQTVVPPSGGRAWAEPWREPVVIEADELRRRVGAVAALSLVMRHWPKGGRHDAQLALAGCLLSEGWTEDETIDVLVAIGGDRAKREATVRRTAERVAACEEVTGWGSLAASLPPEVAKVARGWLGSKRKEVIERSRLEALAATMVASRTLAVKEQGRLLREVALGNIVTADLTAVAKAVGAAYPEADVGSIERAFAASTSASVKGAVERGQREAQQRAAVMFERGDHTELARRVKAVLAREGELAFDDGRLWRCRDGLWVAIPDAEVDTITTGFAGTPTKTGRDPFLRVNAGDVKAVRQTMLPGLVARPGWFAAAPPGVAFAGTFVGATGEAPLTGEHRCRAAYAWPWAADAECDAWRAFLEVTYGPDSDVPAFLAEFAGACLFGAATSLQRFVVLFGDGGTGKSVVVRVLVGLMPSGSVISIAPQSWAKEYSRARFVGARLNAVSEMPSTDLFDSESVKAIVSGDSIEAREPYGKSFDLYSKAGNLFAANDLPVVRDMSRGFWRRVVTITHTRTPDVIVPDLAEMLLEAELPGIVAWAVAGGRRALARGSYALPRDEATDRWRIESDTVALWLEERCVIGGGATSTSDCYEDYRYHTITAGQKPVSMVVFSRRMGRLAAAHLAAHRGAPKTETLNGSSLSSTNVGPKESRAKGWTVRINPR